MMPITYASGSGSADHPLLSTPEWWFKKIVKKNFEDFNNNPGSIRHAFNAIVTTHHFYERVWNYHRQLKSLKKAGCATDTTEALHPTKEFCLGIKKASKEEWDKLKLLREVTNTTKHQVKAGGEIDGAMATDVAREVDGELWIYDTKGKCYGRTLDLLTAVIRFWECWLKAHPSN